MPNDFVIKQVLMCNSMFHKPEVNMGLKGKLFGAMEGLRFTCYQMFYISIRKRLSSSILEKLLSAVTNGKLYFVTFMKIDQEVSICYKINLHFLSLKFGILNHQYFFSVCQNALTSSLFSQISWAFRLESSKCSSGLPYWLVLSWYVSYV